MCKSLIITHHLMWEIAKIAVYVSNNKNTSENYTDTQFLAYQMDKKTKV